MSSIEDLKLRAIKLYLTDEWQKNKGSNLTLEDGTRIILSPEDHLKPFISIKKGDSYFFIRFYRDKHEPDKPSLLRLQNISINDDLVFSNDPKVEELVKIEEAIVLAEECLSRINENYEVRTELISQLKC